MLFFRYLVLTLIFSNIYCLAKTQNSLTLFRAISIGLENNYQIIISKQNINIAQNNNNWGIAGRYPTISFGVNQINRYDNTPSKTMVDKRDKTIANNVSPYLDMQWQLFGGFAVQITKDKLENLEKLSQGNGILVVENTIQAIALAYYSCLYEINKLNVVQELLKLSRDRYSYVVFKKELGASVTFDVLQAQNAFLSDSLNFIRQQLNVHNAQLELNLLLAEKESILYTPVDSFNVQLHNYNLDTLKQKMLSENQNLKNQYINQQIYLQEVALKKAALYPKLSLNTGIEQYHNSVHTINQGRNTGNSFDVYANLSLRFNLFNGGNRKRAIQNAKIQYDIGKFEIQEAKHTLNNTLTNLYQLYKLRKQIYFVSLENLKSSKLNLQIAGEKFKNGSINSFNYRDIQLVYLNAALDKLHAMYQLIETNLELTRITGGITTAYSE